MQRIVTVKTVQIPGWIGHAEVNDRGNGGENWERFDAFARKTAF
jgi:hypothetical protein